MIARELLALIILYLFIFSSQHAKATPVQLFESFAGNINFVTGGATLRTNSNDVDACSVTTGPVVAPISGIPAGSTIEKAYLYWSGSGVTPDNTVTFNGSTLNSQRNFTENNTFGGNTFNFWQAYHDVTAQVTGNGNYTLNGLTVDSGFPYCNTQQVHAGFALIVVYSNPSEDFRVLNIFDGLQKFWGNSITLTPNNFIIPPSPINGKFALLTWDGDESVSTPRNGFTENIFLNGTALTDAGNPVNNQYNSTINPYGTSNNFYGVDWDIYNIDSLLSAGDTSATSQYSSGQDFVLLAAEVFLNTNTPSSDLSINKSHAGNFPLNIPSNFTINVTNEGPLSTSGATVVTDSLPAGVAFNSALGTGWNCSFIAPTITCTSNQVVTDGASFPPITISVIPQSSSFPQFTNTASVTTQNFDFNSGNNSSSDTVTVVAPDFSSSTKSFQDLNGGEVDVGDILEFRIELNNTENSPAGNVVVTDNIPIHLGNLNIINTPSGSVNNSTGSGTGSNGNGFLNISNINVAANSGEIIIFRLTVLGSANPGDTTFNEAIINTPTGTDGNPSTPTIIISPSQIPSTGVKQLYIEDDGGQILNRIVNNSTNNITINGNNASRTYTMSPGFQMAVELDDGLITIPIRIRERGPGSIRTIEMHLDYIGAATGTIGTSTITRDFSTGGVWQTMTFPINLAAPLTLPAGTQLRLRIRNTTTQENQQIRYRELRNGVNFRVNLNSNTVIKVETTETYDSAFPAGTLKINYLPGETVYIRSVVSDPFGSYDITSSRITIDSPTGTTIVNNALMTEVSNSGAATKTYEYAFVVPGGIIDGQWDFAVTSFEGTEGTIDHTRTGFFDVNTDIVDIKALKISQVISDPVRGTINPLRIPGAIIQYSIQPRNEGQASPDPGTVEVIDIVPQNTIICVLNSCSGGIDPIIFTDGTPSSNLSYNYSSDVSYSNQVSGGAPYSYTPIPDAQGFDPAVTGFRITPSGIFDSSTGTAPYPNFNIIFRVKIE